MTLHQAIEVLNPKTSWKRLEELIKELNYPPQGWCPKIYRDAAEVVLPLLYEMEEKNAKKPISYREKLAEILGKDHVCFNPKYDGGVYVCPGLAFRGATEYACSNDGTCYECWDEPWNGEEFNTGYIRVFEGE